jgi:hypothetical protein
VDESSENIYSRFDASNQCGFPFEKEGYNGCELKCCDNTEHWRDENRREASDSEGITCPINYNFVSNICYLTQYVQVIRVTMM